MEGHVLVMIATSLDGFIADSQGAIDWLSPFHCPETGLSEFLVRVDVAVMGRRTYDHYRAQAGGWPYQGKRVEVLSHRPLDADAPPGVRVTSDLVAAIREARQRGRTVWVCGGRSVIAPLMAAGVVDEVELYTAPLLLGQGTPLWPALEAPQGLELLSVDAFRTGLTRSRYRPRVGQGNVLR